MPPTRWPSSTAELDIAYADSPLTVNGAHRATGRKAGERWPEKLPAPKDKARFIALGPGRVVTDLASSFPRLVQAAPEGGEDLHLIRPDGYVGFAGTGSDRDGAAAYLEALVAK